jgi:hypothetical protein
MLQNRRHQVLAALAISVGLAACGGPPDAAKLRDDLETMVSTAQTGRLLSQAVERADSPRTFTRVEAEELSTSADDVETQLSDAPTGLSQQEPATQLAGKISDLIDQQRLDPADQGLATRLIPRLDHAAQEAQRLADSLP